MVQTQVPATHTQQGLTQETNNFQTVIPPVDIFESNDNVILIADIPGIERDHLDINVENNVLTLYATTQERKPADQVYREFRPVHFYRQFSLSERVNAEHISAELKNGVVRITLPKQEDAKPKRIEVKTQ